MNFDKNDTAVVFIDPQNDVLSEKGISWPLLHESLKENTTIENMERIFKAAKAPGYEVFISPHYFSPPIKDGRSTARSNPMRLRTMSSVAKED